MKKLKRNVLGYEMVAAISVLSIGGLGVLPVLHAIRIIFFGEREQVGDTLTMIVALLGMAFGLLVWIVTIDEGGISGRSRISSSDTDDT